MTLEKQYGDWILYKKEAHEYYGRTAVKGVKINWDRFIETCPFKDLIFNDQEIFLIWLGGSYADGLIDEYSDIDLIVLAKEHKEIPSTMYLTYKGIHVHWYVFTIENYFTTWDYIKAIGKFKNIYLSSNILWRNIKYNNIINWFLSNETQNLIIKSGITYISSYMAAHVYSFLANPENNEILLTKFYATLLLIEKYLNNNLNDIDISFLIKVKRMFYTPLTDKDLLKLQAALYKYNETILKYWADFHNTLEFLTKQWADKIDEYNELLC